MSFEGWGTNKSKGYYSAHALTAVPHNQYTRTTLMSVRVAIIGTGWADRVQIPAFQAAGLEVVAIAGRDLDRTVAVAARHGVGQAASDWRELLDSSAAMISVTTPPQLHLEQGIGVLEAGKHLLMEKPLAQGADDATALEAAAARHPELLALVDHELRFLPARQKAKELLGAGTIGRVLMITARVAMAGRIDPTRPWNWWSDANQGGGVLATIGSHAFDGIRWLMNDPDITISGATVGTIYPQRKDAGGTLLPVTSDDIVSVSFAVDGAVGTMLLHTVALDGNVDLLTFRGTDGTLVIDRSLKLYLGKRDGQLKEYKTQLPSFVPNRFRASGYAAGTVLLGRAIVTALAKNDAGALASAATIADGAEVQRLLDRVRAVADMAAPR